ncbi:hypothetical protein EJ04DRAFT_450939 [Polyplosphaeria fusca]|uniref:Uncharacterized protein n=1 Tax=Polyplosphaeria fusca TaxID=682080 RepID=A0A9P4UTB3_9PLEO|nr:hypothetical protein EJ04DRAFT_450939 [Polyplosphaeria fusca]
MEDALKTLEDTKSSLESATAGLRKEYHEIDEGLSNPALHSDAPWGFVVFRTRYGTNSDAPWARMLELLRSTVTSTLLYSKRTDLFPRHELTVVEDEATLAGADAHTVRHLFRAWTADDLTPRLRSPETYGGSAQVRAKLLSNDVHDQNHPVSCLPPRWNFCLFVDEDCLRSLDTFTKIVKIVTTNWHEARVATVAEGWEDGETDEDHEEVGWMYMDATDYVDMYDRLDSAFNWDGFYQRPPAGYIEQGN